MNGGAVGIGEAIVFWVSGTLAVIGALGMVISKKAVHSALFIALTMINLAILYVANAAPFLGMVQIIVYTGAVMMLFLFVLMVVGVDSSDSLIETIKGQRVAAFLFGVGFSILLIAGIGNGLMETSSTGLDAANARFSELEKRVVAQPSWNSVLSFEFQLRHKASRLVNAW